MKAIDGTALKCVVCGTEIKGGFYNSPRGAHCCQCWKKVPSKTKAEDLEKALKKLPKIHKLIKDLNND